jgi:hypothetical protein
MEKTKKSVAVPDSVWQAAKAEAKRQGILFSVFIERLIRAGVPNGAKLK